MFDAILKANNSYSVILEPDQNTPEWWAGAPSVCRGADGTFYLACRMREGNSPRGVRGYEIRILKSADGVHFKHVKSIKREDAGVAGFERPAIVHDPLTGRFKLYGCAGFPRGWCILKFDDADDPAEFKPATARKVIEVDYPDDGFARITGYKDPFVIRTGGRWHMFVIGYDRIERIFHFISDDGEKWVRSPERSIMENSGWHDFYCRPACVLPMAVGYLFVYEGSSQSWVDPVYNIATGLAYSPDLENFFDLTPTEPLLKSTTPGQYHTWRYSHWLVVGDEVFAYAEVARPNKTNEVRLLRFPLTCL
ncbi:MAG TPA: hypothetical protein PL033_01555 [Candidatus Brocadiia bacterium]|nr:hypothetical protein [Candidatus Brocadiia bacterium]